MGDLRSQAQGIVRTLPLGRGLDIVSINAELTMDTLSPALNFIYLSPQPLTDDAKDILATLIAGRLSLPSSSIQLNWLPKVHGFALPPRPGFSTAQEIRLKNINALLSRYPQLAIAVDFPMKGSFAERLKRSKEDVLSLVPMLRDTTRVVFTQLPELKDSLYLTVRVQGIIAPTHADRPRF